MLDRRISFGLVPDDRIPVIVQRAVGFVLVVASPDRFIRIVEVVLPGGEEPVVVIRALILNAAYDDGIPIGEDEADRPEVLEVCARVRGEPARELQRSGQEDREEPPDQHDRHDFLLLTP